MPLGARTILAPLFCLGLLEGPPARLVRAWTLVAAIVATIVQTRTFDPAWRAVGDAGVVAGLSWGLVAVIVATRRAFTK